MLAYLRYLDTFVKQGGTWRFAERNLYLEFSDTRPPGATLEDVEPLSANSDLLIALFVGLSIPVIGAGISLDRGASPADTVLVFTILVGSGVSGAGPFLIRGLKSAQRPT